MIAAWIIAYLLAGFFFLGLLLDPKEANTDRISAEVMWIVILFWPLVTALSIGEATRKLLAEAMNDLREG